MTTEAPLYICRADSPWRGQTSTAAAEAASLHVLPYQFDPPWQALAFVDSLLPELAPFLAIHGSTGLIGSRADYFGPWQRGDATSVPRGAKQALGIVKGALSRVPPQRLFRFVLQSQLVITCAHIEAHLQPQPVKVVDQSVVRQFFSGYHVYFTNQQNQGPLNFALEWDRSTGQLWLLGQSAE